MRGKLGFGSCRGTQPPYNGMKSTAISRRSTFSCKWDFTQEDLMPSLVRQVAIVSEVSGISLSELTRVSAALQKQVTQDFGPIWDVTGTVDPFNKLEDVPIGYWPIIVRDDIGVSGAAGVHEDKNGQPYALVTAGSGWALTASHETLEMLADPFGNRVVAGDSPKPGQGRVEFLVEVCDPSEAAQFGYQVNGITLSDFYTPQFFDAVQGAGVRYSFTGKITGPRQVLDGGYLSWHDPVSDHWWQLRNFGAPDFADLGVLTSSKGSMRSQVDGQTQGPLAQFQAKKAVLESVQPKSTASDLSSASRGAALRGEISRLLGQSPSGAAARAEPAAAPKSPPKTPAKTSGKRRVGGRTRAD
jgi:hypothetical protein